MGDYARRTRPFGVENAGTVTTITRPFVLRLIFA
jgi:hypothetical protein